MGYAPIEYTLPDKPEVAAIAAYLEIDPDAALGKVLRWLLWVHQFTSRSHHSCVTLRVTLARLTGEQNFADALEQAGWLERLDDEYEIINYDRWFSQAAKRRGLAASRASQYRKRRDAARDENVTQALRERDMARDENVTDSLSSCSCVDLQEEGSKKLATLEELIRRWNGLGVCECRQVTMKRRKAFSARAREPNWLVDMPEALERIGRSAFCRGDNERGWRADIDWFLRPDTLTKILEGKYDDGPSKGEQGFDFDGMKER